MDGRKYFPRLLRFFSFLAAKRASPPAEDRYDLALTRQICSRLPAGGDSKLTPKCPRVKFACEEKFNVRADVRDWLISAPAIP